MSVLAGAKVEAAPGFNVGTAWDDAVKFIRNAFGVEAWAWYNAHKDDVLFIVHKWFLSYTVRVSDCRDLVVILFGPEPTA